MQSTIVELSRYTADDKPTNAEWTNRLSKPVILENEDYIMVKQAFVDTRLIDQTSILIEQDVQWTLQFMYWVNNCAINTYSLENTTKYLPDGLPYVLLDMPPGNDPYVSDTFSLPVVDDFTINIPKGTYERSYLAEFITRQLQSINRPARQAYKNISFSNNRVIPQHDVDGNCTGFSKGVTVPQYQVVTPFLRPVFFGMSPNPLPNPPPQYPRSMIYTDNNALYRQAFLYPLTDSSGYAVNPAEKKDLVLCNQLETVPAVSAATVETNAGPTGFDLYDGGFIGCSEVAFVYNDANGDNRFSFQYAHTPLMNNGNQSVGTFVNNPGVYDIAESETVYMNAYSGIMFVNTYTNLSDNPYNDPFLQQLGFSYNDIVSPNIKAYFNKENAPIAYANYRPLSYYNDFLPYTTYNLMTLGDIVSNSTATVAGSSGSSYNISNNIGIYARPPSEKSQYLFNQSSITAGIVASNIPTASNTSAGHYLVELQCAYVSEYINQEKNYQVKAIVGNYFLSGDSFCMSMGPDSFMHQHQGVNLAISSIKVRLLNPVTKEPAENLGANSTIYLQITKEKPTLPKTDKQLHDDKKDEHK
jgi:hypothetical protein